MLVPCRSCVRQSWLSAQGVGLRARDDAFGDCQVRAEREKAAKERREAQLKRMEVLKEIARRKEELLQLQIEQQKELLRLRAQAAGKPTVADAPSPTPTTPSAPARSAGTPVTSPDAAGVAGTARGGV